MGGYATKGMGTAPISAEELPKALEVLSWASGIPIDDLVLIGSTGKTPISNDIDIAIDSNRYPFDKIHALMSFNIGNGTYNHGTGVASYSMPIVMPTPDNRSPARVQVDLMFTPSIEWAKFAYHSPQFLHSDYKGAVRTLLLMGVTSTINVEGYDWFQLIEVNGDDQLLIRVGRTFDLNKGIRRVYQYRPQRKDGKGYLKSMKSVTLEELREMFPFVHVSQEDLVIDDPREALHEMFGRDLDPRQVDDAESVIRLINSTFKNDFADRIYKNTANRAQSVKDKMKLPPEIKRFL